MLMLSHTDGRNRFRATDRHTPNSEKYQLGMSVLAHQVALHRRAEHFRILPDHCIVRTPVVNR